MHTSSFLVAALAAAATLVSAHDDRPRIYFPRHVKRTFVNATSTQDSPHTLPPPTLAPTTMVTLGDPVSASSPDSSIDTSDAPGTTKRQTSADIFSISDPVSRSDALTSSTSKRATTASSQTRDLSTSSSTDEEVTTVIIATTVVVPPSTSTPTSAKTTTTADKTASSSEDESGSSSGIVVFPGTAGTKTTSTKASTTSTSTTKTTPNLVSDLTSALSAILDPTTTTTKSTLTTGISHSGVGTGVSSATAATTKTSTTKTSTSSTGTTTSSKTSTTASVEVSSVLSSLLSTITAEPTANVTTTTAVETSSVPISVSTVPESTVPESTVPTASTIAEPTTNVTIPATSVLPTESGSTVPTSIISATVNTTESVVPTVVPTTTAAPTVVLPTTTANSTLGGNTTETTVAETASKPVTLSTEKTTTATSTKANTQTWLPSTIIVQPTQSTVTATGLAPTTATGLPTGLPQAITPDTSSNPAPEDTMEIQIAFGYGLNYEFVAVTPKAAAQVLKILPELLAFQGKFDQSKSVVQRLVPYDTTVQLGYVTMLAICTYPTSLVDQLRMDMHIPTAPLWNDPDQLAYNMSQEINPAIDILLGSTLDYTATGTGSSATSTATSGSGDLFSNDNTSNQTASQRGMTAGIAVGAIVVSAAYGGAMFVIARRYKRRKQSVHRRSDSLAGPAEMRQTGSPALMGGALLSRDFTSSYGGMAGENAAGGRDSRGSGRSNMNNSGRTAFISAPVAAENSLGWN